MTLSAPKNEEVPLDSTTSHAVKRKPNDKTKVVFIVLLFILQHSKICIVPFRLCRFWIPLTVCARKKKLHEVSLQTIPVRVDTWCHFKYSCQITVDSVSCVLPNSDQKNDGHKSENHTYVPRHVANSCTIYLICFLCLHVVVRAYVCILA